MDPILPFFAERVRHVTLHPPAIPYLSNLTGTWIRPEEATDPDYWVRHLRNTVRFSECLATLLADADQVLLEVGPGRTLSQLACQQPARSVAALHSLGTFGEGAQDLESLLKSYGQLWVLGCKLDGKRLYKDQQRRRVPLPTYPFERHRYWIEPDPPTTARAEAQLSGRLPGKKARPRRLVLSADLEELVYRLHRGGPGGTHRGIGSSSWTNAGWGLS